MDFTCSYVEFLDWLGQQTKPFTIRDVAIGPQRRMQVTAFAQHAATALMDRMIAITMVVDATGNHLNEFHVEPEFVAFWNSPEIDPYAKYTQWRLDHPSIKED